MNPIKSIKLTLRRRVSIDFYRLTDKVDIVKINWSIFIDLSNDFRISIFIEWLRRGVIQRRILITIFWSKVAVKKKKKKKITKPCRTKGTQIIRVLGAKTCKIYSLWTSKVRHACCRVSWIRYVTGYLPRIQRSMCCGFRYLQFSSTRLVELLLWLDKP